MAALVDQFREQVFGLCYRMLGHRQDAEDMAQETFVRALASLASWDPLRDFRPWLLAIAANRCRSLLAVRGRRPVPMAEPEHIADARPDAWRAQHLAEELELALETLRDEYRQAFVLFHTNGLSCAEVAEILDCPVGTVKTWIHRARLELARRLHRRGTLEELPDAMR